MIRLSLMGIWHWISHPSQALWVVKRMDGRVSGHKSKGEKKMKHTIERTEMKDMEPHKDRKGGTHNSVSSRFPALNLCLMKLSLDLWFCETPL